MTPPEEIMRICSLVWEEQNNEFKTQIPQKWFKSYVAFNKIIDEEYRVIRTSNYQLTPADYIRLSKEPIDGKVPTAEELSGAVRKYAANGVMLNHNIYLKLKDYVGYYRENTGKTNISSGVPMTIDHDDLLVQKQ